jgi:DNA-binding CsgD family transcriptional regulator/uncharacterized coiled-coil protein SlyX
MISAEHHTSLDQQHYELRLQQLELEIKRQRETIEQIGYRLGSQDGSLSSLKAYVTLMVATWHSEIGIRLNELTRKIDRTTADDKGWLVLRNHVESAQGDFSRHIEGCSPALSELETRVCLLLGMELTTAEIASTLNLSQLMIESICSDIRAKLDQTGDTSLRQRVSLA